MGPKCEIDSKHWNVGNPSCASCVFASKQWNAQKWNKESFKNWRLLINEGLIF